MKRINLIAAREARSYTQVEMAKRLGIGLRMYQYIEGGGRTGRYELWQEIAAILGADQDYLRSTTTTNLSQIGGGGKK